MSLFYFLFCMKCLFLLILITSSMRPSLETYHDLSLSILLMTEASGHRSGFSKVENNGATKEKPYYYPLYWLVYRDPYNDLL